MELYKKHILTECILLLNTVAYWPCQASFNHNNKGHTPKEWELAGPGSLSDLMIQLHLLFHKHLPTQA